MFRILLILFITLTAFYFGTGGFIILENEKQYEQLIEKTDSKTKDSVKYQGIPFKNKKVMTIVKQQDLIQKIYPYSEQLPSFLIFILTAISFGVIGAIAYSVNSVIKEQTEIREIKNLLLIPVQGGFIGLIVLGISFVVPVFLTNENVTLSPISVVILSLLGGIMHNEFYGWITNLIKRKVLDKDKA